MTHPAADLELLDRDPSPPARGPHWERLVGLLLVVGLAAAGGWQWVSAGTQHAAYRTGVQAETAQDWDAALAAYTQAGDYNDAPIRRSNTTITIRERDAAYATASSAFQRQDWAALLPALPPLERLAPTYRDTPRFIAARETEVYTPALSGTVALRPSAQPPGLYTYRSGWHWLAGSDPHSQIEARCPNGDWLLDVALPPMPGATPLPTPPATASNAERLAGRRLALVTPDGTRRLLLDPTFTLHSWDYYICDSRQVWGISFQLPATSGVGQEPYMLIYTGTRQSLSGGPPQVPVLPGPGWFFGLPATDGQQTLLVDKTGIDLKHPQIGLAVADPTGSRLRALGTFSGTLQSNSFSPDGRWLLVTLNNSIVPEPSSPDSNKQQQRVLLWDLSSTQAPQTLAEVQRDEAIRSDASYLYAGFLNQSPYGGRILLLRYGTTPRIRVLAPDGSAPDQIYDLPAPFYLNITGDLTIDHTTGQLLMSGATGAPRSTTARYSIAVLTPPGTVSMREAPMLQDQSVQALALRAGYALFLTGASFDYQLGVTQAITLTSLPLIADRNPPRPPRTVYTGTRTMDTTQSFDSWHAGTGWLAYATANGELHARRYDGSGDVLLERGVSGFTAVSPFLSWDTP